MIDCTNNACGACCGSSGGCNRSCGGEVALTEEELAFLRRFEELPFLPLGRERGGERPVFMDNGRVVSDTLMWLRLKGLVSLDYDMPLVNFDYGEYEKYPVHGSMALTLRGQAALESVNISGVAD